MHIVQCAAVMIQEMRGIGTKGTATQPANTITMHCAFNFEMAANSSLSPADVTDISTCQSNWVEAGLEEVKPSKAGMIDGV